MPEMLRVWAECLGIIFLSLGSLFAAAILITLPIIYLVKGF
jgi:hypothetical protein